MTASVIRAHAASLPLPDGCVDLIVTSPPYFGLRSYTDGGEHYPGQIGSEATPGEWLDALWACTREWVRVLKPEGSLFVNLGDKYSSGNGGDSNLTALGERLGTGGGQKSDRAKLRQLPVKGMPPKSLLGLPWRYAIGCTDQLGLILRAEIVWCLSGGARVYARTASGDRPIMLRDLVRSYRPESIQLWNGERWTQVLGWNRSPDRDGALELELRTGERIGCTPGHRWPTQRGVIRADEIRVGDVIQTTTLPAPKPRYPAGLDDEKIGWFIGLYLAEGSRSEKTLQFAGHVRETIRHAQLEHIARAYDGTCAIYRTSENGVTCNLSGAVLLGIIDHYIGRGRTAKSKRLRKAAWQRNNAFLTALAKGYLEGDGHYDTKNDRWRLGFGANDELAADLRTLAARLGAKISLRRTMHTMNGRRFPGWRGEWRWHRPYHWNAKLDGEVVAIRASRAREFYDVGVADEPHLFALASGVLTHNSKPNGLPESVTDRVRRSHEQVFHFTRQPRYYAAVDEIRETYAPETKARYAAGYNARKIDGQRIGIGTNLGGDTYGENPLGKLPGSVWAIPSQPLQVPAHLGIDHFAAFPMELPRRVILGWSPPGVCVGCGQGRRPVAQRATALRHNNGRHVIPPPAPHDTNNGTGATTLGIVPDYRITGYACACSHDLTVDAGGQVWPSDDRGTLPPVRPAIVLDPFGGTGTTALVASVLGRHGITADLSMDYARLAQWRVNDPGERARALQVPKPPPVMDGQEALFGL